MASKNKTLTYLYTAHGIFMLASIMLTPLFALFVTGLGNSVIIVGYLGSLFFVSKATGTILMRVGGDKINNQNYIIALGYGLKTLAWLGLIYFPNLIGLFIIQGILGFSEGIQSPAFRASMSKNLDSGHEISQSADWEIILAITGIIGTTLGGTIVSLYGFQTLFIVMSILSTISLIVTLQANRYTPSNIHSSKIY